MTGFNGTNILITGGKCQNIMFIKSPKGSISFYLVYFSFEENSRLFEAEFINGFVKVTTTSSSEFPRELTHIALELQAGSAKSVLLIDVSFSGMYKVVFSSVQFSSVIAIRFK